MDAVFPRKPVPARYNVPLLMRLGEFPVGRTRNLSINGVFLEIDARPPVGSQHELVLAWDSSTFHCTARVVRHTDDGIGLAFEHADSLFKQAIDEILAETGAESRVR